MIQDLLEQTDEWFSYSPRGELTDVYEKTPHSGGYYHTTAAYWPKGALETLSGIPGVPTLNYGGTGTGLDGEGRYTKVTAASGTNPVTAVTYSTTSTADPLGSLLRVTFGSADFDSFTYNPKSGRMATYTFSVNSVTDKGTLTWNTNGTLKTLAIVDGISGTSDTQTCNYVYDDAQRVSSANCGTPWSQTFTYDSFGNVSKSGSSSFSPIYSSSTNQFTSIPGVTVRYDANGELLTDNLNTYTWNVYSNPVTVNSTTLTYDAFGQMVEQQNGSAYTEILYSPVGKTALMNGQTLSKAFVNLPGGAIAIYNSTGLAYYRHSDWLGSSRLTSTRAQALYSSSAYAPFGEQYKVAGTSDASFTGQNADTASSLYDFTFREHSPSQGRWISPDPAGVAAVDPTNPQSWNRYAYVTNNPTAAVDPLGLADAGCSGNYECTDGSSGGGGDDPRFTFTKDVWANGANGGIGWLFDNGISWSSGPVNVGGVGGGGGGKGPAPSNTGCFVKGLVSGAVGAAVVGGVAAGAVALSVVSAPVATAVLTGAAVIGGGALLINSAYDYATGNTAGLAYNAGSFLGGAVVGGLGARIVYGQLSPGQTFKGLSLSSLKSEFGQMFNPKMGPPNLNYWGTGPTSWFAAGGPAAAGAGASTAKKGGC